VLEPRSDEGEWDVVLRWERFHRGFAPVDFRRWKRASQAALRALYPAPDVRVLDATAGLGDHTVNLAELGFTVTAGDASAVARDATGEAVRAAGLDVEVADLRWERVGQERPEAFDLVFHDALHWLTDEAAMDAALRSLRAALRPGGALVFFFADPRDPGPGAGERVRRWDLEHLVRHELAWRHPHAEGHVTCLRARTPTADAIEEHHLFLVEPGSGATLESAVLTRVYRWDFHTMEGAVARAGFRRLEGRLFTNDKGHETAMCLAHR
jgi:SAM-dependent methyltransferase